MIRGVVTALALLVFWALLIGWAAQVSLAQPWSSPHSLPLSAATVNSVFGTAEQGADGLRISALGPRALGLQTWSASALKSSDYGVLHYQFKDLPRDFGVDLIIRTAANPHDVASITLPWPGDNGAMIDLDDVAQWHGTITEIGFSEYPNPQLVPPGVSFQPFTLVGASLQQPSWSSALHVLASNWFGYTTWQQSSINSLSNAAGKGGRPLLLVLAIGALGSVLLLWLLARIPLRRSLIVVLVLAWLVMDAHWLGVLGERHAQTRAMYAGTPGPQRQELQADRALVQAAAAVKRALAGEPQGRHVLVWAPTPFARGRLGYHLRPLNVHNLPAGSLSALASGAVLLIDDDSGVWHYDAGTGVLSSDQRRAKVQLLWRAGKFGLYRIAATPGARP